MRGFLHQALATLVATGLLVFSSVYSLNAQNGHAVGVGMERDLAHAEALLRSFKNDSANIITAKLLDLLKAQGHLDSPFGIQVRLAEASALEQDEQNELAILKLLQVKESSKEKNLVDIHSKVCLTLALLYEKIGRGKNSLEHLRETKADIDHYALDSIYPYFAIRMSSWQRIYGNKDSSIYFAKEALRTAPLFRLYLEEAIGHMLMNMLLPKSAVAERLGHSMDGLSLYQKLNDYTGCGFMYSAIANIHFQNNDLLRALVYNDSTISAANKAIAIGCERDPTIASTYRLRGEIYRAMGQQDSAWHYVHKGYRIELDFMERDNRDKVIEIDSRYNDAQQTQQIKEQNLSLALKNTQLRYSLLVALLILLLAGGVFIAYRKQRQGKQKLSAQNTLIQRQSEQLKSLDAAKSRFFANVSHELRTPLALMLGPISTLLKENKLTDKQANLLQLARQSGKQLEQLVTDILDLGKLEMGKMELDEKPTELAAFFRTYFAQFESLAESRQIDFRSDIAVGNDVAAYLDQAKCRQILNNLLSNAFKFTPAGGKVNVELKIENLESATPSPSILHSQFSIQIRDTGPGIHPDDLPLLFDRYFQTTRPDKPAEGGTGIGLALCHTSTRNFLAAKSRWKVHSAKVRFSGWPSPSRCTVKHQFHQPREANCTAKP